VLADPQELHGVGGSNVWTHINGLLTARPVGNGHWKVRGEEQLGHVKFTVAVPDIERVVFRAGRQPSQAQAIFRSDREALEEKLCADIKRRLNESGASCEDLQVVVAEDLDSATVSYRVLTNFADAHGGKMTHANGSYTLRPDGNDHWQGTLADMPLTVSPTTNSAAPQEGAKRK
jgi:hypothetical protein